MSNEVSLKQAIDKLINAYKLRGKLNEVQLTASWEKVMGPVIARKTDNLFIKDRILHIKINSPALKEELNYSKALITEKVNESLQQRAIDDVKFI